MRIACDLLRFPSTAALASSALNSSLVRRALIGVSGFSLGALMIRSVRIGAFRFLDLRLTDNKAPRAESVFCARCSASFLTTFFIASFHRVCGSGPLILNVTRQSNWGRRSELWGLDEAGFSDVRNDSTLLTNCNCLS